jgi:hypothetical protein
MVTSNHIHLLVNDTAKRVIPQSMLSALCSLGEVKDFQRAHG